MHANEIGTDEKRLYGSFGLEFSLFYSYFMTRYEYGG